LIAFDHREHVALLNFVTDALAHVANDPRETRRHLNQQLLVGLHDAVQ